MGSFAGIVILSFILVIVYINVCGKKDNIEEDKDYTDIGGIERPSDAATPDGKKKEEKKINENEE